MDYDLRLEKVRADWAKLSAQKAEYESKYFREVSLDIPKSELEETPEKTAMKAAFINWKKRVLSDRALDIVARAGLCDMFVVKDFDALLERAIQLRAEGKSTEKIDKDIGAKLQEATALVSEALAELG